MIPSLSVGSESNRCRHFTVRSRMLRKLTRRSAHAILFLRSLVHCSNWRTEDSIHDSCTQQESESAFIACLRSLRSVLCCV